MSLMKRLGILVLILAVVAGVILIMPYDGQTNVNNDGADPDAAGPDQCPHEYRERESESVQATCMQEGKAVFKCKLCDAYTSIQLPTNHVVENGACSICGQEANDEDDLDFRPTDDGTGYIVYLNSRHSNRQLTDIIIPSHVNGKPVVQIGGGLDHAPSDGDSVLRHVYIPDTVKTIGMGAFESMALESLTIPEGVELIGSMAFSFCRNMKSIVIPSSVTSIGSDAFSYCYAMTRYEVYPNNEHYQSMDGNLYTDNGKTFYRYAGNKQDTSFVIPDGVTKIAENAFMDSFILKSITIPEGVHTIGRSAFCALNSLESIVIPESVTVIDETAFALCISLESVTIPAGVEKISAYIFNGCDKLTSVTYTGTVEQWNALEKGYHWNSECPFTTVICSDGETSV